MSMFWSGYSGVGLAIVDPDDISYMQQMMIKSNNVEDWEDWMEYEFEEYIQDTYGAICISNNSFEGCYFNGLAGRGEYLDEYFPVYFFFADKQPILRSLFSTGFYSSKEEIIKEFQIKLGNYLPHNFEWENAIGEIQYACFA